MTVITNFSQNCAEAASGLHKSYKPVETCDSCSTSPNSISSRGSARTDTTVDAESCWSHETTSATSQSMPKSHSVLASTARSSKATASTERTVLQIYETDMTPISLEDDLKWAEPQSGVGGDSGAGSGPEGADTAPCACCITNTPGSGKTEGSTPCCCYSSRRRRRGRSPMDVPLEPLKWFFLLTFLVVAGVSNWAVLAYTHDLVSREPLSDILFKIFPEQEWASRCGDWMVTVTLCCLIILVFFHKYRIVIMRRVVFCAATLYAMRSCTLLVTQLPPGYENNTMRCRERINSSIPIFLSRLGEQTIRLGFQEKTSMLCGDLLFSGHTLVMVTCALAVSYYLPKRWRLLQWIPCLAAAVGIVCLIISRTHYSVDVVIAYWLSSFVFRSYHAFCEVDVYLERRKSILYDMWLFRIVNWLEQNIVPGRIENEFGMPFDNFVRTHILNKTPGHHKQISISSASTFNLP